MWQKLLIGQLGLENHRISDPDIEPSISKLLVNQEKSLICRLLYIEFSGTCGQLHFN